jgi:hypothetical protein
LAALQWILAALQGCRGSGRVQGILAGILTLLLAALQVHVCSFCFSAYSFFFFFISRQKKMNH